jgi:O-acetyl-ADP-ribose deacetylase (regulator of RNase III)
VAVADAVGKALQLARSVKTVRGDLIKLALDGHFDVVIHGCNCHCVMGAGIALPMRNTFPEAFAADCATAKGDRAKLGTISVATVERGGRSLTIVNGYTQFDRRGDGVLADYDAIRSVMRLVKTRFAGKRIGYPMIGAGLAKGDWSMISLLIEEELSGEDHTFVEFLG